MGWIEALVNGAIRLVTGVACRVDDGQLRRIPSTGSLILVANHFNFLETPPGARRRPMTSRRAPPGPSFPIARGEREHPDSDPTGYPFLDRSQPLY